MPLHRSKTFRPDYGRANGNSIPCLWCTREGYKTARKPWRHLHNHSTYCADRDLTVTEPLPPPLSVRDQYVTEPLSSELAEMQRGAVNGSKIIP